MSRLRPILCVVGIAAFFAIPAASAASPAPGAWSGVEYYHGKRTDFLTMRFSVTSSGRFLQRMRGTVHAECQVAGGTGTFQDFSLDYSARKRIASDGRLTARFEAVTHSHGSAVHRTLTLKGRFSGRRASGTLDFQSYIEHSGPGCTYHAAWRATRSR